MEPAADPAPRSSADDQRRDASDERLRAWAESPQTQEAEELDDFAIIERIVPQTKPRGLLGISFGSIRIDEGLPFETPEREAAPAPKRSLLSLFRRGRDRAEDEEDFNAGHDAADDAFTAVEEERGRPAARTLDPPRGARVTAPPAPSDEDRPAELPGPPPKSLRQPYRELRQPVGLKPKRPDPFPELRKPLEERRPKPEPFPELRRPNLDEDGADLSAEQKRPAAGWLSGVLKSADLSVGEAGDPPAWLNEDDDGDTTGPRPDEAGTPDADDYETLVPETAEEHEDEHGDYRRRAARALAQAALLDDAEADEAVTSESAPGAFVEPDGADDNAELPAGRGGKRRGRTRRSKSPGQLELGLPADDPYEDELAADAAGAPPDFGPAHAAAYAAEPDEEEFEDPAAGFAEDPVNAYDAPFTDDAARGDIVAEDSLDDLDPVEPFAPREAWYGNHEDEGPNSPYSDLLDPTYRPKRGFMDLGHRSILVESGDGGAGNGEVRTHAPEHAGTDYHSAAGSGFVDNGPEDGGAADFDAEWNALGDSIDGDGRLSYRSLEERTQARPSDDDDGDDDEYGPYREAPAFIAPDPTGRPEQAASTMRSIARKDSDYYTPPSKTPAMVFVGVVGALCGALVANTVYGMLGDVVVPRFMVLLIGVQVFGGIGLILGSMLPGARTGPSRFSRSRPVRRPVPAQRFEDDWADEDETAARPPGRDREPMFARQSARAAMRPLARE